MATSTNLEKNEKALKEASFLDAFMTRYLLDKQKELAEKREALQRQDNEHNSAVQSFIELSGGNPGTIVLGRELEDRGFFEIQELVTFARQHGLIKNGLYILHKYFGDKDVSRTAGVLRTLQKNPEAELPLVRSGNKVGVISHVLEEMERDAACS